MCCGKGGRRGREFSCRWNCFLSSELENILEKMCGRILEEWQTSVLKSEDTEYSLGKSFGEKDVFINDQSLWEQNMHQNVSKRRNTPVLLSTMLNKSLILPLLFFHLTSNSICK